MKYIKNIKLLLLAGLLLQVGVGFAYSSDGQAILARMERETSISGSELKINKSSSRR